MIRPLLYLIAGLLMAPALALAGSLWLVAVGVPDALDAWPADRIFPAVISAFFGVIPALGAGLMPTRTRRRTLPVADQTGEKR